MKSIFRKWLVLFVGFGVSTSFATDYLYNYYHYDSRNGGIYSFSSTRVISFDVGVEPTPYFVDLFDYGSDTFVLASLSDGWIPSDFGDADGNGTPDGLDPAAPVDTDGDGISDDDETALGSDPNSADTDSDGVDDGVDPFPTNRDLWEPTSADGDQDGDAIPDFADIDRDGDGVPNSIDPDMAAPSGGDYSGGSSSGGGTPFNFENSGSSTDPLSVADTQHVYVDNLDGVESSLDAIRSGLPASFSLLRDQLIATDNQTRIQTDLMRQHLALLESQGVKTDSLLDWSEAGLAQLAANADVTEGAGNQVSSAVNSSANQISSAVDSASSQAHADSLSLKSSLDAIGEQLQAQGEAGLNSSNGVSVTDSAVLEALTTGSILSGSPVVEGIDSSSYYDESNTGLNEIDSKREEVKTMRNSIIAKLEEKLHVFLSIQAPELGMKSSISVAIPSVAGLSFPPLVLNLDDYPMVSMLRGAELMFLGLFMAFSSLKVIKWAVA